MTDLIDDDSHPTDEIPGLVARRCAMLAIDDLLIRSLPLDETLDRILSGPDGKSLSDRDLRARLPWLRPVGLARLAKR